MSGVENEETYSQYRKDLLSRQLSNSEKYDTSILTLSMAALGVSFTFLSNVIKPDEAKFIWLLILSWISFGLSIVIVICSFRVGNRAINEQIKIAYRYYMEGDDKAINEKSCASIISNWLNHFSGGFFVVAVMLTVAFVSINFSTKVLHKEIAMTDKSNDRVVQVPSKKSADIPAMQPKKVEGNTGDTNNSNNNNSTKSK